MSVKKTLAGVVPFAHLLGNRPRAARAEGDEQDRKDDEDDDKKKGRRAEDDSDDDDARRAEGDDKDRDEGDDADDKKGKKAKKGKRADKDNNDTDGDDADAEDESDEGADDNDDDDDDTEKAARNSERARCARIIAHGVKIGAVRQAGVFAFNTKMSSRAAIAALNASALDGKAGRKASLGERMAGTQIPNPGASSAASAPTQAELIVLAGKKRRGEI